jgi:hypothetical protein
VAARRAEWLPPPYCHTVCPVPHALKALIVSNTRLLLTLLFRAASPTLLHCGQQHLGGQLGATMGLPPWAQTRKAHCHLHCLVPAGALAEDGARWVPTHPRFLFPVQALRMVLRATFLAAGQQAVRPGALRFPQAGGPCAAPADCPSLLAQRYGQPWGVYAQRPCAGPAQVLDSLGRAIHRVAMATHRLREVGDGYGRFTWRHRRQANQVQSMTRAAQECRRRFLRHGLPHGFQRRRHIGFLANRCKARPLPQCRHLLGQLPAPPPRAHPSAAERIRQLTGLESTPCPHGGHAPLVRSPLPPGRPDVRGRGPVEVPHVDSS